MSPASQTPRCCACPRREPLEGRRPNVRYASAACRSRAYTDRSPEPADEREWTLCRDVEHPHFPVGLGPVLPFSEPVLVVPKSRLESAMAAADERERELQRSVDEAAKLMTGDLKTIGTLQHREAALTEALREKQEAVDFAAQALRSSEYVGGPSQREAWHLATVALFDAETERKATNPDALPVESEPEEGWCERCKGKATLTRTVIGAAPTMRLCSDCVAESDGRTDA